MTGQFEFRDAYGRWVKVTPCWVMNPWGEGGRPAVQFRLACGECLQVPQGIVPDVLVAVRELAGQAGPKSPAAVHTPARGGIVKHLPLVGEGAGTGCVLTGCGQNTQNTVDGTCSGRTGTACSQAAGTPGQNTCQNTDGTTCSDLCGDMFRQVRVVESGPDCGMILVHPEQSGTSPNTAGTPGPRVPRPHPGDNVPPECEHCGTQTQLMAGGAYAACARIARPEPEGDVKRSSDPYGGWVRGQCPACKGACLFVAEGGFLTCSRADCPDPEAPTTILTGRADGWVRTSEALAMVRGADEAVERLTSRALAVRERVLLLEPALRDELLQLLTDREAPTGSTAAAVAACAADPEGAQ
ncbi:hypothetical protein ACFY0G_02045 [Streptomyces sp. NPDC001552]|uniref:hypothetical protein n=1 Tax=Streptomyces sp. NPDC001552 TaxID=3364587 RepID=UPI0036B5BA7E